MKQVLLSMIICGIARVAAAAEQDCRVADQYLADARQQAASAEFGEASNLAKQAVDACPSYDAVELLGELRARSLREADHEQAADAFSRAIELAPTDKAQAWALYNYAGLLSRAGDPQNARPMIMDARTLDPDNHDIAELSAKIEARIENPSSDQLVRGLQDSLVREIHWAQAKRPRPSRGSMAATTAAKTPGSPSDKASGAVGSIAIPINFETASTVVDPQTQANVAVLAAALSNSAFAQKRFQFIGHADVRGDEQQNVMLSRRRAEAISQAIIALQPDLKGRIDVVGRGSVEPVDPAHNERAYRANRRLQVQLD